MANLVWDQTGERLFETGVDRGVLYVRDSEGNYPQGVVWNGLTTVTESPTGAEATPQYADNIKYLNLISNEEFEGTIEAFTYPEEFGACDGTASPSRGVFVGQQRRSTFGFSYRTRVGNDVEGDDLGYKLHLVWGALASPSEKAYATVNDTPEAINFSWSVTTTGVPVEGFRPVSTITIDSTTVDPTELAALEEILYGSATEEASLPLPGDVLALFSGSVGGMGVQSFGATEDEGTPEFV